LLELIKGNTDLADYHSSK